MVSSVFLVWKYFMGFVSGFFCLSGLEVFRGGCFWFRLSFRFGCISWGFSLVSSFQSSCQIVSISLYVFSPDFRTDRQREVNRGPSSMTRLLFQVCLPSRFQTRLHEKGSTLTVWICNHGHFFFFENFVKTLDIFLLE